MARGSHSEPKRRVATIKVQTQHLLTLSDFSAGKLTVRLHRCLLLCGAWLSTRRQLLLPAEVGGERHERQLLGDK